MKRRNFIKSIARIGAGLCLFVFGGFLIKFKSDNGLCIDRNRLCAQCRILRDCNEAEAQIVKKEKFV